MLAKKEQRTFILACLVVSVMCGIQNEKVNVGLSMTNRVFGHCSYNYGHETLAQFHFETVKAIWQYLYCEVAEQQHKLRGTPLARIAQMT